MQQQKTKRADGLIYSNLEVPRLIVQIGSPSNSPTYSLPVLPAGPPSFYTCNGLDTSVSWFI